MSPFGRLEMRGIRKEFGGLVANDAIDLTMRGGENLGLLGENGAGKSTLMNVLFGLYPPPEAGRIFLDGQPVRIASPRDARHLGIGMVHQHFMLIPTHTAAENLAQAVPDVPFFAPAHQVPPLLREFSERYGLQVDPDAYIWELSAGRQQPVEIVKARLGGARLLVLDEPTSVLTPGEAEELLAILDRLRAEGQAIIFITHKLEGIRRITDRVQILRGGRHAGTVATRDVTKEALAKWMVGRRVEIDLRRPPLAPQEPLLEVIDLSVMDDRGRLAVRHLDLTVHGREIVGIAGVSGNG